MTDFVSPYSTNDRFGGQTYDGLSAVNGLIVDGSYVDGSWELCIEVEGIDDAVTVRVRDDTSLGGLMHQVVETVNVKQSWSDYSIWWPQKNMWLLHTRTSLDQYGVQSDAQLVFRRTHGNLQIVLPSLQTLVLRVNYASRVFSVVENICKELCIRRPEELSLMFPIKREGLKLNQPLPVIRHGCKKTGPLTSIGASRSEMPSAQNDVNVNSSTNQLNTSDPNNTYPTLPYGSATLMRNYSTNSLDDDFIDASRFADCSQRKSAKIAFGEDWLLKPKNTQQKARMDGSWLDSSRSLMEHGVEPPPVASVYSHHGKPPTLYLRFKFYNFYDLNVSYDAVRIHQLYEQARWSLLAETLECTEDEMVVFAAYQLQAELQNAAAAKVGLQTLGFSGTIGRYATLGNSPGYNTMGSMFDTSGLRSITPDFTLNRLGSSARTTGGSLMRFPSCGAVTPIHTMSPILDSKDSSPGFEDRNGQVQDLDEIDLMLTELELSCNVTSNSTKNGVARNDDVIDNGMPVLQDSVKVFRDRIILLRRFKEMWTVLKEGHLMLYRDPHSTDIPQASFNLRNCVVTPGINSSDMRFDVKLSIVNDASSTPNTGRRSGATPGKIREVVLLRFSSLEQFSKWVTAFRLAARGKLAMSRAAFDKEVKETIEMAKQQPTAKSIPALDSAELIKLLGDLTDFCAERIIKKGRSKETLRQRIIEAHANLRDLSLIEAKLKYIQDWQRLNNFGRSYCLVQFDKGNSYGLGGGSSGLFSSPSPNEDIIAIRHGRIEVISPATEEAIVAWNFSDLRCWNVNWDNERVILEFRSGKISCKPLTANCKTIVELIGGYVFLGQRTPEKNQNLDERVFHKLTGAND